MGFLGSAGLMLLALLGSPLFIVILAAAMLGFLISEVPLTVIGIEMYRIVETPCCSRCLCSPSQATFWLNRGCPNAWFA